MISAVVLTKNEEKNIEACLKTLEWCDEIVVIDDFSTDGTLEIMQSVKIKNQNDNVKVKIFRRRLGEDFSQQRNFGLEKAQNVWVMFVDADERVTPALAEEIQTEISKDRFDGYFLKRTDFLYGQELKYGETAKVKLLRLMKKGSGKWRGKVHEEYQGEKGTWGELENSLRHYPHPDLTSFLEKVNFYSTLRAEELYQQKVRSSLVQIIFYPVAKFVYIWLFLAGWRDGMPGMIVAVMMSFHAFLTRSKLYLLARQR